MNFIVANDLKPIYGVIAQFEDRNIDEVEFKCRSKLIIYNIKGIYSSSKPDAFVVMMNPGSSQPIEEQQSKSTYSVVQLLGLTEEGFLDTKPDNTQYQIMRVMQVRGWNYIVVLNLSDIRNAKSEEFLSKINDYPDGLSIFSNSRKDELTSLLCHNTEAPIIAAWGIDRRLRDLISKATSCLSDRNICGRLKDDQFYYHASSIRYQDKLKWLSECIESLPSRS